MDPYQGKLLSSIPGWQEEYVKKLEENGIMTAEQVVGTVSAPRGVQLLANHLGVSEKEMRRLCDLAIAELPPSVAAELQEPVDTSQYGLGALPPDEQS